MVSYLTSSAIGADKRPNVLFISIDDLNDWLGCYGGHPQVKTPHIDRLAGEGVLFSNAHCQAPICNPSRVSLILGQLPSTTGMYFLAPNFRTVEKTQDAETLFQYFRRHDYYLSTMGKIFHGKVDKPSFDHLVGMVLDGLEASGEADNTIIVLWSDHGFHLGEKQRWAKRTLWEETTRVPLIITAPGMSAGEVCSRPVGLIDLYPTLTDMCGLPSKADNEGVSLKPLLQNPHAIWEQPVLTTFGPNNHSIRSEHWRYTQYVDGTEELYDHRKDPNEWTNLASNAEYAQIMGKHRTSIPTLNAVALPGSAGSDSPLYGEGGGVSLSEVMGRVTSKQ